MLLPPIRSRAALFRGQYFGNLPIPLLQIKNTRVRSNQSLKQISGMLFHFSFLWSVAALLVAQIRVKEV